MSLLKLRQRHRTIASLNSILNAQQVVTMVTLQRIREKSVRAGTYLRTLQSVLAGRLKETKFTKQLLVVVSSNRGLCGAFNLNVVNKAVEFSRARPELQWVVVGKRGVDCLRAHKECRRPVVLTDQGDNEHLAFSKVTSFLKQILALEAEVFVAYNTYKSPIIQIPKVVKLWPIPEELAVKQEPVDMILEPAAEQLIDQALQQYLTVRLFKMLLDSQIGELGARLIVLKGAVDNSKELIDELNININKARQAGITSDLLEIIGSSEALRSDYE